MFNTDPNWNPSDIDIDGFGEFVVTGVGSVVNRKVSTAPDVLL